MRAIEIPKKGGPLALVERPLPEPKHGEVRVRFSAFTGVKPTIEVMPLEKAPEAYERMMKGDARFRIVLKTTQ